MATEISRRAAAGHIAPSQRRRTEADANRYTVAALAKAVDQFASENKSGNQPIDAGALAALAAAATSVSAAATASPPQQLGAPEAPHHLAVLVSNVQKVTA